MSRGILTTSKGARTVSTSNTATSNQETEYLIYIEACWRLAVSRMLSIAGRTKAVNLNLGPSAHLQIYKSTNLQIYKSTKNEKQETIRSEQCRLTRGFHS